MNHEDIAATAAATLWFLRLREAAGDEATLSEWLLWRDSSPQNAMAYERVRTLWSQLDDVLTNDQIGEDRKGGGVRAGLRTSKGWFALAAAMSAVAVGLWVLKPWHNPVPAPTAVRENRSSILSDGSAVELGAKTSIAPQFSATARLLHLSTGEAYFKVKPDAQRPFTVRAGNLDITAVGTAFDVNHQPGRTSVTVQEGLVAIRSIGVLRGTAAERWQVAAGHQLVYSERDGMATLASVDTSAVLAWREGRLEYTRAPLDSVLADINRYAKQVVSVEDAETGKLTFTGTVFTDSISDWLSALPGALPVTVERDTDRIVLRRR